MSNRIISIEAAQQRAKDGGDLVLSMAFASTEPYTRWWGVEILQVDSKSVRLGRMNDGAPLLFNHDLNDLRGTIVPGSVRAEGSVLRGQVRITSATQAGRDTIALVESGVLSKASVGYQIHKVVEQTTSKSGEPVEREIDGALFERMLRETAVTRDGRRHGGDLQAFQRGLDAACGPLDRADDKPAVYRVTDWEPFENSLVTVPADPTVGVGRSMQPAVADITPVPSPAAKSASSLEATMAENTNTAATVAEDQTQTRAGLPAQPNRGASAQDLERERVTGIRNFAASFKIDDNIRDHWVNTGVSLKDVSDDILAIQAQRAEANPKTPVTKLGLSDSETKRFSLFRAIQATADKNWTNAGFELECSREVAKRLNKVPDPNRFYVPMEVQERSVNVPMGATFASDSARRDHLGIARRDLTVATTTAGGFLVGTQNMSFIEMLRNRAIAFRMGARRMSGLNGNVTVPRQTAAATAVWLANEASTLTESQQTFGQMSLSPKTVGAYTEISRQLLLQSSPDAEGIVTSDLATVTTLAYDAGVIGGSGASGQPTGIINTAGIGAVAGAGFIAAAFARILEFQTDVAGSNVMPAAGGYVTTHAVAASLIQAVKYASTASPIWEGNVWDGAVQGFPAMGTNQMAAASMLFGDWSSVVVGEWGVLEIEVNPYANFQAAIMGVRAIVSMDCGLRYPAAFSLATSIA